MYTFERFKKSSWSLVILSEGRPIFRSRARGILALRKFLKRENAPSDELTVYDKYIGCAAALLMALIKPARVRTPVVSEAGKAALIKYGIPFEAEREVKYLMGIASDEMCRWEKISIGKTPKEFLHMLGD
jgi:hypothetical protein